jgi:Kef-type K+ transport system membrane component KefB
MADISLLLDIGLVLIVATFLAYLARMFRQPLLVAYVLAGIIIGPMGLGLMTNEDEIKILAELGIAFLLFTVGLEIDFKRLRSVGTATVTGAFLQMAASFFVGFGIALLFGLGFLVGAYIGLLLAFSSTMIVAKILVDRNEIKTLHGRIMIGVLLIQDLVVILVLPMLKNVELLISPEVLGITVINGLGLFSIAVVLNRYVFKRLLDYAARNNEVMFLTAVAVCFAFIGLSSFLGFSIAIGAFIGGIALAQFPYNLEIFGEMHSLRDFFSVIFFASLGMSLSFFNISLMSSLFVTVLLLTLLMKPLILSIIYLALGYGGRTSSIIGLGMGQASEFSFILALQGLSLGHFGAPVFSIMVSVVVISMVVTPYFMKFRNNIYSIFATRMNIPFFDGLGTPRHVKKMEKPPEKELKNHVVIFGCDVMGGKIVDYLNQRKKKFIVAEHNPEVIRELSKNGVYTLYGDADNEDLLKASGLYRAKLAIVTIPDVETSGFVIGKAKRHNPGLKIFARAHSEDEADALYRVGADFVVVPDFVSGGTLIRKTEHFLSGGRNNHNLFRHLSPRK